MEHPLAETQRITAHLDARPTARLGPSGDERGALISWDGDPAQPFAIDDVLITWPRALVKTIRAYPDIDFDLHDVTSFLAARFPAHT